MAKKVGRVKVFQYKVNKLQPRPIPAGKAIRFNESENLTGYINGMDASDIEERFARALDREQIKTYEFRVPMVAGRWMPGEVEVDFMVWHAGQYQPVQIDGMFAHKASSQRALDAAKDAILNQYLEGQALPVIRINGDLLDNQDEADKIVKEMFR